MRILTLGGNLLSQCLRDSGHEVLSLVAPHSLDHPQDVKTDFFTAPGAVRSRVAGVAASFRPDWILQVDDSNPLTYLGLESLPARKAWYAIDSHLHWEWHRHYAPLFDRVFCAQRNQTASVGEFLGEAAEWLPLWFGEEPSFLPWESRAHDVSFVGTLDPILNPARISLLEGLKALGQPVNAVQGDCAPVYRASRMVINQSARDDLNFRFFEAIGFGALLVTDRISHSLAEIGEPGRDFLVYEPGDAADLRAKIAWALGHPEAAEAMARRAQAKVAAGHRASHRVRRITEALNAPVPPPRPRAFMLGHLAAAHEHISRLALPGPLVVFFAAEARRHALAALEGSPGEPAACLALAQLDLEKGEYAHALGHLEASAAGDASEEYRRRFVFLRAMLLAHTGRLPQGRAVAAAGLRDFPGDADLIRLAAALGL